MILQIERGLMKRQFALLFILFAVLSIAAACGNDSKPNSSSAPSTAGPMKVTGQPTTTASGLQYWDIVVGTGATAVSGKPVKVHYTGWLTNGKKFDSSVGTGRPFDFMLGAGQVIKGWDEGIVGMKVGGKRQLHIPSDLAYGAKGFTTLIPPNSTLIFDVQLVDVK